MGNYCTKTQVKERALIDESDTTYDAKMDIAIEEGTRLVDIFLKPYTTVPLTSYDSTISAIAADFSTSIFKRRYIPNEVVVRGTLQPDGINDVDATGYFAMGISKLERYIKAYYTMAVDVGNILHNPDIYAKLAKDGIITFKEARTLINDSTGAIISNIEYNIKVEEKSNTITNVIDETKTKSETIDTIVTETKIFNHSKAQKRFAVVESNRDTNYYQKQEDGVYQDAQSSEDSGVIEEGIYRG